MKKIKLFFISKNQVNESHDFFKWFFMCVCQPYWQRCYNHMNICIMGAKKLASWIHYIWYHGYNLFSIKILALNVHMFLWYHFYVSNLCYHRLAICHRVLYEVSTTVNGDWYVKFSNALAYRFFQLLWIQLNFSMDYWEIQISFESYSIWNITWSIYNKYKKKNHCFDSLLNGSIYIEGGLI